VNTVFLIVNHFTKQLCVRPPHAITQNLAGELRVLYDVRANSMSLVPQSYRTVTAI